MCALHHSACQVSIPRMVMFVHLPTNCHGPSQKQRNGICMKYFSTWGAYKFSFRTPEIVVNVICFTFARAMGGQALHYFWFWEHLPAKYVTVHYMYIIYTLYSAGGFGLAVVFSWCAVALRSMRAASRNVETLVLSPMDNLILFLYARLKWAR